MARIHELLPVETDKLAAANALTEEAIGTFTKKADHFLGQTRKVEMYDREREAEDTIEVKEVVETVESKLEHVWTALIEGIDVTLAKEASNASGSAVADVMTDSGDVIIAGVPAAGLLALEKRIGQVKNLYSAIPTLAPELSWEPEPSSALPGMMRTRHPAVGHKTEKVHEHKIMVPATDKHAAQVAEYTLDRNVAKVTVERTSGMVSPATKAKWLRRINQLQTAVKQARQRANMAEVVQLPAGETLRGFIHAED